MCSHDLVPFRIIDVVNVREFFKLTHTHSWLNYSGENSFIFLKYFKLITEQFFLILKDEAPHKYNVPSKIVVY
jgi:hypothetical protein